MAENKARPDADPKASTQFKKFEEAMRAIVKVPKTKLTKPKVKG